MNYILLKFVVIVYLITNSTFHLVKENKYVSQKLYNLALKGWFDILGYILFLLCQELDERINSTVIFVW